MHLRARNGVPGCQSSAMVRRTRCSNGQGGKMFEHRRGMRGDQGGKNGISRMCIAVCAQTNLCNEEKCNCQRFNYCMFGEWLCICRLQQSSILCPPSSAPSLSFCQCVRVWYALMTTNSWMPIEQTIFPAMCACASSALLVRCFVYCVHLVCLHWCQSPNKSHRRSIQTHVTALCRCIFRKCNRG